MTIDERLQVAGERIDLLLQTGESTVRSIEMLAAWVTHIQKELDELKDEVKK
jgi:hypothetical protein